LSKAFDRSCHKGLLVTIIRGNETGRNCHYDTLNISVVICKTDTAQRLTVSHDGDRKTPSICNSDVLIYAMLSTSYIVVLFFFGLNLDDNLNSLWFKTDHLQAEDGHRDM
jgi:hypothetical protein